MERNVLSRSLWSSSAYLAFLLQCFVLVAAFSQSLPEPTGLDRSRRQVPYSRLGQRQPPYYTNRTSNANYLQLPESGPWGPWTESSQCSRTCGGGVAHQDRICMDMRADGRHSCEGLSRRYFSCNIQDCPTGSRDFRSLQCGRFNSVPDSNNRYYSWEPYYHPNSPCELYCAPKGGKFYQRSDTKVIDGTRCRNDGSLDICVAGQCTPVGCDKILGSTKAEDQCGVCGGDGNTCSIVKGVFDKDNFEVGYNDILLIPLGATSILIQKKQPTKNYLSVRDAEGRYYLNGNWQIESPKQLRIGGSTFHYERKPQSSLEPETLRSKGPTTQSVFIVLLYQERNLGISYEYAVPVAARTPAPDSYLWKTGEFEECSQTCGGGVQHRPVRCIRESDRDLADERLCDPLTKPDVNATCSSAPCPSNWKVGEWSECSQECGGGSQFRIVYCHQAKDGNAVLVPDESCEGEKPLFMRSCNVDRECPGWSTGEWSECDSECGAGSQNRSVECRSKETGEAAEDSVCDARSRPEDRRTCSLGPCEGVEWIVSDWSGCEGSCSSRIESREVKCANEEGTVFPDDACESAKMPELTRPCPKSEMCDPMWHTSEWTECSVKCGNGVQSRVVFCGVWENESVIKIEDKNCNPDKRFEDLQNCSADTCSGIWFTGPWNRCSVPCGGGERTRMILCFHEKEIVDSGQCDPAEKPFVEDSCNMTPCDDDEIMSFGGCKDTKYGCCSDGVTPAGLNDAGCHKMNTSGANVSCDDAEFGCCSDGFTLASGPFKKGCPSSVNCSEAPHGCCPDEKTPAGGPDSEGCPEDVAEPGVVVAEDCANATHGCCADNVTSATGPDAEGCDELPEEGSGGADGGSDVIPEDLGSGEDCKGSTFGCCEDGISSATGPDKEGCPETESSGDGELMVACGESVFGCCPDNVTAAAGFELEGCEPEDCANSTFGCCPNNATSALGPEGEGCFPEDCSNTTYGCCPDNTTSALGPEGEGCFPEDCSNSTFGCCPDNTTSAMGLDNEGCEPEECSNSTFGCCPDNTTSAMGFDNEGCEIEDCSNSTFGCCPDNTTSAMGFDNEGCKIEDCSNSTFGCCPDNTTSAMGIDNEGCELEDCSNSTFGCCPDNMTSALGPDGEGCFPEDCSNSTFGCCPDNMTSAMGPDNEGCDIEDCSNSTFGCCPDNMTSALGPDNEGCDIEDCSNSTFGCCPDNVTSATGPDNEGCDCSNSTFGCCPDNTTSALGPNLKGCSEENVTVNCSDTDFGCCPDNATAASGPEFEGCNATTEDVPDQTIKPPPECLNSLYGCCPDEVTTALGRNLEGCCFGMRFGCCPDNKTAALGPNIIGCGCQTYPFGCCPDNISPSQGPNYQGCSCESLRHGCCQDNATPARGPDFQGCECQFLRFGCCPDGVTPVLGDRGEGCGCDSTPYGCCPDGRTAATSADLSGCPCQTLPYGCCPDGHTPARTSDLRDCPCAAHFYACCLDGRTVARGPNYEGCPCDSTRFGCCQDGRTVAPGPGFQGCPCDTTPHGCCADGYTAAKGPRYQGCPSVHEPKPDVSTEVCRLPKEPGPCRNFTVKWFFDLGYGGCSRFWYGGCDGNGNVFDTQEDCEKLCVRPDGPEVCLLPMVAGSCDAKIPSWYFDAGSKTCETFTYGGCLGNNNKFTTKTDCEAKCISKQPPKPVDRCSLAKDEGGCDSAIVRWYYNDGSARCEQFYYGGCKGNTNRFETRRECEKACMPSLVKESDVCRLPHEIGPCNEFRERWYFEYESGQCHRFIFGGCSGNENNFPSYADCEKRCGSKPPPPPPNHPEADFKPEYCFQSQDPGPCSSTEQYWHYDSSDGVCKEFYYGGCKGNRNRFKTRKECEKMCIKAQDMCSLPAVKGPCSGAFSQWYYDGGQDDCFEFSFSGCQGNANRFNSKEGCQQRCKKEPVPTEQTAPASDVCVLAKEPGPCLGYYRAWFYDPSDNSCKSFIYGGCDGNENRFDKRWDCEQRCVNKDSREPGVLQPEPPTRSANEDVCRNAVDPGPCRDEHPRWFYDAQTQNCLPFVYGGCDGNKNRFKTAEICLRFCTGVKAKPGEEGPYLATPTSATTVTSTSTTSTTTTAEPPAQCPPSNCAEIRCPYGIEESFDANECSSCRCSNPCEVHLCPEGSRCAIDVVRTSGAGVRTEPVCRRVQKSGSCPAVVSATSGEQQDCETRCRDDAHCRGEHKCCDNGCAYTCMPPADEPFVAATQPEPATILPTVNVTRAEVGRPAELPCDARGHPRPTVTWWRETSMLPLSSHRYEQLPDSYALLIRSVVLEDRGDYSCHDHNGVGTGATHRITLLIDFRPGEEHDASARDSEPDLPPPSSSPWDDVAVSSAVSLITVDPVAGSPLQIDCATEGPRDLRVTWRLGQSQLLTDEEAKGRRRILSNHTLYIARADAATDTGEYSCVAQHRTSVATSAVYVQVRPMPAELSCIDNPQFSHCEVIVKNKYCNNKYYGKFCCASCTEAGQMVDLPLPQV